MTIQRITPRPLAKSGGGGTSSAPSTEPLEIVTLDATALRASILLQGGSGSGKTHALARLFSTGRRPLVLAVEPKMQLLAQYKPQVIFMYGGTYIERYDKLRRFIDELGAGRYANFDIIGIEGTAEVVDVIHRVYRAKTPKTHTQPMWEDIGLESVDFFRSLRDAAGYVSQQRGLPPIGIVATIAERRTVSQLGQVFYEPMFPGRAAANALPYQFEAVLRLAVERNEDGMPRYVYHTVPSDEWWAKAPPGVLDPVVANPDFAEVYSKVMDYYWTVRPDAPPVVPPTTTT